jgi:hypothetical protein
MIPGKTQKGRIMLIPLLLLVLCSAAYSVAAYSCTGLVAEDETPINLLLTPARNVYFLKDMNPDFYQFYKARDLKVYLNRADGTLDVLPMDASIKVYMGGTLLEDGHNFSKEKPGSRSLTVTYEGSLTAHYTILLVDAASNDSGWSDGDGGIIIIIKDPK